MTAGNGREVLRRAVEGMDEKQGRSDVWRFLDEPAETDLMTKANFLKLLAE